VLQHFRKDHGIYGVNSNSQVINAGAKERYGAATPSLSFQETSLRQI
jgi:hypothetical protein